MQIAVAGEQSAHTILFLPESGKVLEQMTSPFTPNHLIRNEDTAENNNIIFIQLSYACLRQEWVLVTLNLVITMVIMSPMVFPGWWFWDSIWENIGPTHLVGHTACTMLSILTCLFLFCFWLLMLILLSCNCAVNCLLQIKEENQSNNEESGVLNARSKNWCGLCS